MATGGAEPYMALLTFPFGIFCSLEASKPGSPDVNAPERLLLCDDVAAFSAQPPSPCGGIGAESALRLPADIAPVAAMSAFR